MDFSRRGDSLSERVKWGRLSKEDQKRIMRDHYIWEKIKDDKFDKRNYFIKYLDYIYQFVFCYEILCDKGVIDLKQKYEELKHTKAYDEDIKIIISILYGLNNAEGKLYIKDLFYVWGLSLDKDIIAHGKAKHMRDKKIWKYVKNNKKPNEYTNFFSLRNEKALDHISFSKLLESVNREKIKDYLLVIMEYCEEGYLFGKYREISGVEEEICTLFYESFISLVNKIPSKKSSVRGHKLKTTVELILYYSGMSEEGLSKGTDTGNCIEYIWAHESYLKEFIKNFGVKLR